MKNRKLVVIVVIAMILVCSITLAVLVLLKSQQPTDTTPPDSFPAQNIPDNNQVEIKKYSYALINTDDNIKLKTTLGEELLINIDAKSWKNIRWSKDGSYVAVLGETTKDIFNIFIYNLSNKKWVQATIFDKSSVTSFDWIDNDTILFTQGGWLHRYKYSSLNEIVKIYEIEATIVDLSPNRSTILLKDTTDNFVILSIDGKLLFTLKDIGVQNSDEFITIQKIYYSKDSETLLFTTSNNKLYLWNLGDENAKELVIPDTIAELSTLNIICSEDVDQFQAYILKDSLTVDFYNLDTVSSKLNLLTSKTSDQAILNLSYHCLESKIVLDITDSKGNQWYQLSGANLEKLVILDEAKEVDSRNI